MGGGQEKRKGADWQRGRANYTDAGQVCKESQAREEGNTAKTTQTPRKHQERR